MKLLMVERVSMKRSHNSRISIHCNSYSTFWSIIENFCLYDLALTRCNDKSSCYSFHVIVLSRLNFQIAFLVLIISFSKQKSVFKQRTINSFQSDIRIIRQQVKIKCSSNSLAQILVFGSNSFSQLNKSLASLP